MNTNYTEILQELKSLEIFIHWPDYGASKEKIELHLDENFWEVGASGKKYNREIVLKVLVERSQKENPEEWISDNFECAELSQNVYLLTYTIIQGERKTERCSIWKKYENDFKLVYHQGTIVA